MINKKKLKYLIETFIYDKLQKNNYKIENIIAKKLLTWNRFDLAFKLFYLDNKEVNIALAEQVYKEDIKSQTLGKFIEIGHETHKNSFNRYKEEFDEIFCSIERQGFDSEKTIVPLSKNGTIINGSHRVASAILLNKDISSFETEQDDMIADYKYFYERNVPQGILDAVCRKFIEYSNNNIYIAFLWPSGKGNNEEVESKFSNIVYKTDLELTPNGAFNLLLELYKYMDWVGTEKNGFLGAKQKLIECFPVFESFKVIIFQEASLENVRVLKEEVRNVYNIGYSSIHITDTKEEAIRISNLVLNRNGIHFLNYANPYKYLEIYSKLDIFKEFLERNNIEKDEVVIDGSVVLSLYGLRKNEDIDYLLVNNSRILEENLEFESHDSELKYHKKTKENLIYNPEYYFQYYGLKFISSDQLYSMKKRRDEKKDNNDCNLMHSSVENNKLKILKAKIKQNFFYFQIKTSRYMRLFILNFLRTMGLYNSIRWFYRKLKGTL